MLNAERDTAIRKGEINELPVAAGVKIYAGGIVARNAAGYAEPASDKAGLIVYGRAEATIDNTDGAAGDAIIAVREGCFSYQGSGFTAADAGKPVFIVDDETVAKSGGTNKVFAGFIKEVKSADEVDVQMGNFLRAAGAVAAVTAADAATQGSTYAQADVQAIATLANESKIQLNAVIAALKAAGLMAA